MMCLEKPQGLEILRYEIRDSKPTADTPTGFRAGGPDQEEPREASRVCILPGLSDQLQMSRQPWAWHRRLSGTWNASTAGARPG